MDIIKYAPLFSGSSGNSAFFSAGGVRILIDAGMPLYALEQNLSSIGESLSGIDALLITHEHTDHIRSAGALARRYGIPIYANAGTWQAMESSLGKIKPQCIRVFESGRDFCLKSVNILPFRTPHDAAEPVGFRLNYQGESIAQATDIGHVDSRIIDTICGCHLVMLEANHDVNMLEVGPYPYSLKRRILSDTGHLSNEAAGNTLVKLYGLGIEKAILGHLSQQNNYGPLALETVKGILYEQGVMDLPVALASADTACVYEVEVR